MTCLNCKAKPGSPHDPQCDVKVYDGERIVAVPRCIWCNMPLAREHVSCAFGEGKVEHIHVKQPGDPVAAPRIAKNQAQQVRDAFRKVAEESQHVGWFEAIAERASDDDLLKLRRLLR